MKALVFAVEHDGIALVDRKIDDGRRKGCTFFRVDQSRFFGGPAAVELLRGVHDYDVFRHGANYLSKLEQLVAAVFTAGEEQQRKAQLEQAFWRTDRQLTIYLQLRRTKALNRKLMQVFERVGFRVRIIDAVVGEAGFEADVALVSSEKVASAILKKTRKTTVVILNASADAAAQTKLSEKFPGRVMRPMSRELVEVLIGLLQEEA